MKKATNAALMRIKNEKAILSLINKAPVSRVDIANKTGLTKAAVTIIADDLKQRNIIIERSGQSNSVGRTPVMLYLNSEAFNFIGVNITRRNIYIGITNLSGKVITQDSFPICPPHIAAKKIKASIDTQLSEAKLDISKIYKIAVAAPGPVDEKSGTILNPPNFNEWHNFAIAPEIGALTGFDTILSNVSSAMAVAEKYFGSARNSASFLALQVDEGIGSGIVTDDSLFKGPCEFGHTSIRYDGVKCECGNRGCLEKYASIPQILKGTPYSSWQEAVDSEDIKILDVEADYLSTAIVSANNIFSFDKIVLCGDMTYKPENIINMIYAKIKNSILSKKDFEVCAGTVKSKHLIAAALAVHDLFV